MRFRPFILTTGFILFALACTPEARVAGVTSGINVALCIAENQELPDVDIIAKCVSENVTPADVTRILMQQRAATKRAATRAACPPAPASASPAPVPTSPAPASPAPASSK